MEIVTVRRVGNSNVISLPRAFEDLGYTVGTKVVLDTLPTGEIVVRPAEVVRDRLRDLAREAIAENREALGILESYDRGESTERPMRHRHS
jgi:antitoxin component of MazEF toxin-antitoxin module